MRTVTVLALLLNVVNAGQAQEPQVVSGVVTNSISGKPLVAELYFDRESARYSTGRDGRFALTRPSGNTGVIVIRRIGYVPRAISLDTNSSALGAILLKPVATPLDKIAVEAEEVRLYPFLDDFYRRRREGVQGQFFTKEDIGRAGTRKTSDLLGRSNKVELDCDVDVIRGGDECIARNRRYRGITAGRPPAPGVQSCGDKMCYDRCIMDIFVDGKRSTLKVDEIPLRDIAGIEIYSGTATTPAAFGRSACGVIAIWTSGASG